MSVSEDRHRTVVLEQPGDDAIDTCADISHDLAMRATVPPHRPVRSRLADLHRGQTFVIAVVPLTQVVVDDRTVEKTGE